MRKMAVPWCLAWLLVLGVVLGGCRGETFGPLGVPQTCDEAQESPIDPYQGPTRWPLQVVEIGIPPEDLQRYPELATKQVGFGLSALLLEVLLQTERFDLLEGKPAILEQIVEQWKMSKNRILVQMPRPNLQAAAFLVYAEIFNFVACSPSEQISLLQKRLTCVTSVGVQVRLVKTMSRELLLGSTDSLKPEGMYCHTVRLPLFGSSDVTFDQSAVGKATYKAMRYAMRQLLQRFDEKGWGKEPK